MDQIRVEGLTRLDALELSRDYPDAVIQFEGVTPQDAHHGELATAAVVAVTVAGLQALAAWLMKNRKRGKLEKTLEIVSPDGARRTETLTIDLSQSTAEPEVLRELGRLTGVDLTDFEDRST